MVVDGYKSDNLNLLLSDGQGYINKQNKKIGRKKQYSQPLLGRLSVILGLCY